ncbi:hypothetical protein Tco_0957177 [Tanacetum coccineum]
MKSVNSSDPTLSSRPTKVEVPKELPKVSMVNTSLKKLKHHLAGFDVVAVEQHRLESKTFEVKMNKVLNENERLLEQVISKDIVNIIVNSSVDNAYEIFQRDNSVSNQSALSFDQYFELNELKAQSQEKDTVIKKLKERIKSLCGNMNEDKGKRFGHNGIEIRIKEIKEKSVVACRETVNKPKVIAPEVHKGELEPLSLKLKNNRETHVDYIRITKENADTLHDVVELARTSNPLDNALAYDCMYTKQIQELLVYVSDTCLSSPSKSETLVAITPVNKAKLLLQRLVQHQTIIQNSSRCSPDSDH